MANPPTHVPEDLLSAYLLGKLAETELVTIEGHLSIWAECKKGASEAEPHDTMVAFLAFAAANSNGQASLAAARLP